MVNLSTQINKFQKINFLSLIIPAVKVARPVHWIKNLAIFAALVFTGNLLKPLFFTQAFWAFLAFNFTASAAYIFNDIFDIKFDRLHPIKKNRPIASGKLPLGLASLEAFCFAAIGLFLASGLNILFYYTVLVYLVVQIFYSLGLKNIPILDILMIAFGFILRVYAGAFVINAHLSVWFLLCVISVALFLASGKRRAELNITRHSSGLTRKSLTRYSKPLLDSYVTMFGNASWMAWALFTFFESPQAILPVWLFLAELSRTTTVNKLLMVTIPVVIFGIMRYEALIFAGRSEAPEKLFLTDKALVLVIILWLGLILGIFYSGILVV